MGDGQRQRADQRRLLAEARAPHFHLAAILRQRAAVCLRTGGGGGLYACATMLDFIKGE